MSNNSASANYCASRSKEMFFLSGIVPQKYLCSCNEKLCYFLSPTRFPLPAAAHYCSILHFFFGKTLYFIALNVYLSNE